MGLEFVCRLVPDTGMASMAPLIEYVCRPVIADTGLIFRLACAIMLRLHAPIIHMQTH